MSDIGFLESKTHWSNESLVFWRFTSEILSHKTHFVDSSLPAFSLSFSWTNNFEHFCLSHWLYFFDWHIPFSCFLFALLFHHIRQDFWVLLLFSIHQICRDSTIFNGLGLAFGIFLFVGLYGLLHLYFLLESFFVKDLGFDTAKCLGFLGNHFSFTSFFLPSFLFCIESLTEPLLVEVHIVILWHFYCWIYNKTSFYQKSIITHFSFHPLLNIIIRIS